jgi:PIN domain nuclease of toxin-antitoxin system
MTEILLDTHTFLWWALEPDRLPEKVLAIMGDPKTRVLLSAVSSWEAQIKIGLGKLTLSEPLRKIVERELIHNNWEALSIQLAHTWKLEELPPLHKDPFDRLLIAQALVENLVLVTRDPLVVQYPHITTLWG